jgi:mannosyltransferase OCH1-like enzyme
MWDGWNSWLELNPGWERHFIDDDAMEHHILRLAAAGVPELLATYRSLPKIVLKSDLLRYVIMYTHGGVWTDIDTRCYIPISQWAGNCSNRAHIGDVGLIVGTELDGTHFLDRDLFFSQFTFAAGAGHPVLREVIARIIEYPLAEPHFETILKWTGPRQWTDAITDHLNATIAEFELGLARHLTDPKLLGDVCIAPIYAFGSGRGQVPADDPRIWAQHFFHGTWVHG